MSQRSAKIRGRGPGKGGLRGQRSDTAPPPSSGASARFLKDPRQVSGIYIGSSVPTGGQVDSMTFQQRFEQGGSPPGVLAMPRRYYTPSDSASTIITAAAADLGAGRIPCYSWKTPVTAAIGMSGAQLSTLQSNITTVMNGLKTLGGVIFFCVFHEPENNTGANTADFEAAWAATKAGYDAAAPSNVLLVKILMGWTFQSGSGRPTADWVGDTSRFHLLGIDYYAKSGQTLTGTRLNSTLTLAESFGKPIMWPEFGRTRLTPTTGTQAAWDADVTGFIDTLIARQHVAALYFDSQTASTENWRLNTAELATYNSLRSRTSSKHLTDVP